MGGNAERGTVKGWAKVLTCFCSLILAWEHSEIDILNTHLPTPGTCPHLNTFPVSLEQPWIWSNSWELHLISHSLSASLNTSNKEYYVTVVESRHSDCTVPLSLRHTHKCHLILWLLSYLPNDWSVLYHVNNHMPISINLLFWKL